MKINGKWYFNEVLTNPEPEVDMSVKVRVQFLWQGNLATVTWLGVIDATGGDAEYRLSIDIRESNDSELSGFGYAYYIDDGGWMDDDARTWDFGAAYQEVSDEFYTWLTANAVQLSKPIPMTHPKGIKLLTKGHKLSKDIEVVPTFLETVDVAFDTQIAGAYSGVICYTTVENGSITNKTLRLNADQIPPITALKNSVMYLFNESSNLVMADDFVLDKQGITDVNVNLLHLIAAKVVDGITIVY